jgi:hypothetical protein
VYFSRLKAISPDKRLAFFIIHKTIGRRRGANAFQSGQVAVLARNVTPRVGACVKVAAMRRNRFPFPSHICPRLTPAWPAVERLGIRSAISIGELAMVPAQPQDSTQEPLDISSFMRDDFTDDESSSDDMVSLLEENARLRKLVIRLSEIVLRNVADEK